MKIRIREGNDFDVVWAIKRGGVPEDLSTAINMKLTLVVYGLVIEHNLFTVADNVLSINIPKEVATVNGDYRLIFEYTLPDTGQPDGDLKCKTDVVPFRIVPFTAKADDIYTINVASDIAIGLKGDKGDDGVDAYQIWLDLGNEGTYEDFIAYLRQPAVDAGASISELEGEIQVSEGLRVQAESERVQAESERQITIQEAVTATQEATTAASLADTARLAIQDDLALKANQTDLVQLADDIDYNLSRAYSPVFEQGTIAKASGAKDSSLYRVRTIDFISVDSFNIEIKEGFVFNVYYYDIDENYIKAESESWINSNNFTSKYIGKIKIVIKNEGVNIPISPNDDYGLILINKDTLGGEVSFLSKDFANIQLGLNKVTEIMPIMEQGTVRSADGSLNYTTTRIRTRDYLPVDGFSVNIGDNYIYTILLYDHSYVYVGPAFIDFSSESLTSNFSGYIKIVIKNRYDDGDILPDSDTGLTFNSFYSFNIANDKIQELVLPNNLEQGSISSSNGLNASTITRIRTRDYLSVDGFSVEVNNPDYLFYIFYYDDHETYIYRESLRSTYFLSSFKGKIRVVIKHKENVPIGIGEDIQLSIKSVLSFGVFHKYLQDNTLSKSVDKNAHFIRGNYDVVAHRGVWIGDVAPENSTHSVMMAKRYGFKAVECDVRKTKDNVFVVMHDATINRTMRNTDYSTISDQISVSTSNFNDLRDNYILASPIEKYRTKIPTCEEFLLSCRDADIFPLLHTTESGAFPLAQSILGDNWCCFTSSASVAKEARRISNCLILYSNNSSSDGVYEILEDIGGWCGYSTALTDLITDDLCRLFKTKGWEIQASMQPLSNSIKVINTGATILLSDSNINLRDSYKVEEYNDNNTFEVFETTGVVSGGALALEIGQTISKTFERKVLYGGVDIELYFKGSINININGSNFGNITNNNFQISRASLRFYDKIPTINISALEHTTINNVLVKIADF